MNCVHVSLSCPLRSPHREAGTEEVMSTPEMVIVSLVQSPIRGGGQHHVLKCQPAVKNLYEIMIIIISL